MRFDKALGNDPMRLALAAILVVGFLYLLVRKTISDTVDAAGAAVGAANDARLSAASGIADLALSWFHPNSSLPDQHLPVTFPDGKKHAISTRDIDARGFFVGTRAVYPWYDGKPYRIGMRDGVRYAVAA